MELSEKAVTKGISEALDELSENAFMYKFIECMAKHIEETNAIPDSEKMFLSMVAGYATTKIIHNQAIFQITQEKLHEKMDGYEWESEDGTVNVILTEKGQCKDLKEVAEFLKQKGETVDESEIKPLTEIELQRYKKSTLEAIGGKGGK